jgi:hypothetical protein
MNPTVVVYEPERLLLSPQLFLQRAHVALDVLHRIPKHLLL